MSCWYLNMICCLKEIESYIHFNFLAPGHLCILSPGHRGGLAPGATSSFCTFHCILHLRLGRLGHPGHHLQVATKLELPGSQFHPKAATKLELSGFLFHRKRQQIWNYLVFNFTQSGNRVGVICISIRPTWLVAGLCTSIHWSVELSSH